MQGVIVLCKEDIARKIQTIEGLNEIVDVLKEAVAKKTVELEDLKGKKETKDGQDGCRHSKVDGL